MQDFELVISIFATMKDLSNAPCHTKTYYLSYCIIFSDLLICFPV